MAIYDSGSGKSPKCLRCPSTRSFNQPRLCSEPHEPQSFCRFLCIIGAPASAYFSFAFCACPHQAGNVLGRQSLRRAQEIGHFGIAAVCDP